MQVRRNGIIRPSEEPGLIDINPIQVLSRLHIFIRAGAINPEHIPKENKDLMFGRLEVAGVNSDVRGHEDADELNSVFRPRNRSNFGLDAA